jgi:hypothetical protein
MPCSSGERRCASAPGGGAGSTWSTNAVPITKAMDTRLTTTTVVMISW